MTAETLISFMRPKINRYAAEQKNPTYTDFYKGYLQGWLDAYREMQELLEQEVET